MGHRLTTALSHPPLGCDAWRLSDVNEIEMWDCAPSIDSPRTFADDAKRVAVTVESRTEVWGAATQSLPMIRRARREPRSAAKTPRKEQPIISAAIEAVLAETMGERQAIFRLRYQAYVWEGLIPARAFGRTSGRARIMTFLSLVALRWLI